MPDTMTPRYPIYIPSKGRIDHAQTARMFIRDSVPFLFVVEPQEAHAYAKAFGKDKLLILPENDQGLIYARNWIRDYSTERGDIRHWQVDDNIRTCYRRYKALRVPCHAGIAFRAVEDFVDRYENVALAGMNYDMFIPDRNKHPPFRLNVHVYSNTLFLNALPHRFRPPANEDVDMCLQVLSDGWCIIQFNAFVIDKSTTMTTPGGQTDEAYQGDGRLFMARALERKWPGIVTTKRRFNRPQHVIAFEWRKFDNELRLRKDVDLSTLSLPEETLKLTGTPKSPELQRLFKNPPSP